MAGANIKHFYDTMIAMNGSYEINDKQQMVLKKFMDGVTEPNDIATYIKYYLSLKQKTNSLDKECRLVFGDFSTQ
jgi:hypothetical protein